MTVKTTFDIPEPLVRDIKRIARERGVTARAIVQQALMRVVDEERSAPAFRLPDAAVEGWTALTPEAREVVSRSDGLHELVLSSYGDR